MREKWLPNTTLFSKEKGGPLRACMEPYVRWGQARSQGHVEGWPKSSTPSSSNSLPFSTKALSTDIFQTVGTCLIIIKIQSTSQLASQRPLWHFVANNWISTPPISMSAKQWREHAFYLQGKLHWAGSAAPHGVYTYQTRLCVWCVHKPSHVSNALLSKNSLNYFLHGILIKLINLW